MRYLGGKARYGEEIARVIRSRKHQGQTIREPFCGACWVSQYFGTPGPIICSDIHEPLILLHQAIQQGTWKPPDFISEEEYNKLHQQWKEGECSPWIGFAGFACSWGGKWFGGYARDMTRNFCLESKRSLLEKHERTRHILFVYRNYRNLNPQYEVIYCDPPYRGTTGYNNKIFDTVTFWQIMRKWSQNNTVIVSEYEAPNDWKVIWEAEHFSMKGTDTKITTEKLFELEK